jgi:hypothetical protein
VRCSTLPTPKYQDYSFPSGEAFFGDAKQAYQPLGLVRAKVNYQSLDPGREEGDLCKNYFNKAVQDLVKMAHEKGGDAVIDVKSVVFFESGENQLFPTPECSDDGFEGQVLAQGIAIQWKKLREN